MKKGFIIFVLISIASVIFLAVLGRISQSGSAAGLANGKLVKCPAKPNCVCSEQKEDTDHYINPITLSREMTDDTLKFLEGTIQELGGVIQTATDTYLSASFTSTVFGFRDDFEARVEPMQNIIHVRSASRVGYSDFDANKKRVELIKELYKKKADQSD